MSNQPHHSPRIPLGFLLVAIITLGGGMGILKYFRARSDENKAQVRAISEHEGGDPIRENNKVDRGDSEIQEITGQQLVTPAVPRAFESLSRKSDSPLPSPRREEPTAYTRQLVTALSQLDPAKGGEQATDWRTNLKTLVQQGAVAVPAILEFLERNQELSFGSAAEAFGYASLRSALISSLDEIGGPEATAALLQVMRTSALPSEIATIAGSLEKHAAGQYRAEEINAINDVLDLARKGQLTGQDVAPLFRALQSMGDSGIAALDSLQKDWRYYSSIALAAVPDGQGVSTLVRELNDPSADSHRGLALEMLAEIACKNSDASVALLEAARSSQLSDALWRKIASGLAGDQYQLSLPPPTGSGAIVTGLKTFHIESGNQNFYSLPLSSIASSEEMASRRALAQQLLASARSSVAVQVMQHAVAVLGASP